MPLVRKVGIEFNSKGNLEKTLKSFERSLKTAHTLSEKFRTSIATLGSEKTLSGLNKTVAAIDKIAAGVKAIKSVQVKLVSEQQNQTKATLDSLKARKLEAQALKAEEQAMQTMAKGEREQADRRKRDEQDRLRTIQRRESVQRTIAASQARWENEAQARRTRDLQEQMRLTERLFNARRREAQILARQEQKSFQQRMQERREARTTLLTLGTGSYWQAGQMVAGGLGDLVNNEAMRHYLIEKQGLVNMGLGKRQTGQILAAARNISYSGIQGLSHAGELDVIKDLALTFGKNYKTGNLSSEALNPVIARDLAKFAVASKTSYGLGQNQTYAATKIAELLTPNQKYIKDHGKLRLMTSADRANAFSRALDLEFKALGGLGGKMKPTELLQFMKRSNAAKYGMTSTGLLHLIPVMQESGGSQTGRQFMSVIQNLGNGVGLNSRTMTNLLHMGLLNPGMVKMNRNRNAVEWMKPGALRGDKELREDPFSWYEKYLAPKLKGKSMAEAQQTISSILNNRTAMSLIMTFFAQDARIHKDTALAIGAMGVNASYNALQKTYPMAVQNFDAAWKRLQVDLGVTMLPTITSGLNALAAAIEDLDKAVKQHPTVTKVGIGGAATVAGVIGTAALVQGAKKGIALVRSAFGLGGAAATGPALGAAGGGAASVASRGLLSLILRGAGAGLAGYVVGEALAPQRAGFKGESAYARWYDQMEKRREWIYHHPGLKAPALPAASPEVRRILAQILASGGGTTNNFNITISGANGSPDELTHHVKEGIRQALDEHAHSMLVNQHRVTR